MYFLWVRRETCCQENWQQSRESMSEVWQEVSEVMKRANKCVQATWVGGGQNRTVIATHAPNASRSAATL